jgi:hypothetical protein
VPGSVQEVRDLLGDETDEKHQDGGEHQHRTHIRELLADDIVLDVDSEPGKEKQCAYGEKYLKRRVQCSNAKYD